MTRRTAAIFLVLTLGSFAFWTAAFIWPRQTLAALTGFLILITVIYGGWLAVRAISGAIDRRRARRDWPKARVVS